MVTREMFQRNKKFLFKEIFMELIEIIGETINPGKIDCQDKKIKKKKPDILILKTDNQMLIFKQYY